MRIRSIKPEYWRSDDITALPISTRLTFIGLWSYVDDNGVGADKLVSIVADLYADDFSRDPLETVKRVTEDLQRLTSGGLVLRYRGLHNGSTKDLLYITKWKQHQKVNHPSLGHKYPLPPAEILEAATGLAQPSSESLETLTHEQGNRGTEEQGNKVCGTHTSPFCSEHPNGTPARCGDCANARTAFNAAQAETEAAERERAQAIEAERRRRRAVIDNCHDCDDFGRLEDLSPCPRHPQLKEAVNG